MSPFDVGGYGIALTFISENPFFITVQEAEGIPRTCPQHRMGIGMPLICRRADSSHSRISRSMSPTKLTFPSGNWISCSVYSIFRPLRCNIHVLTEPGGATALEKPDPASATFVVRTEIRVLFFGRVPGVPMYGITELRDDEISSVNGLVKSDGAIKPPSRFTWMLWIFSRRMVTSVENLSGGRTIREFREDWRGKGSFGTNSSLRMVSSVPRGGNCWANRYSSALRSWIFRGFIPTVSRYLTWYPSASLYRRQWVSVLGYAVRSTYSFSCRLISFIDLHPTDTNSSAKAWSSSAAIL